MRLQSVQKAQRELVDKVNVAARTASSLEDALESRVRENEEAIAAIDGSRTTVTNQLRELKDAVAELDARLSAPSGSPRVYELGGASAAPPGGTKPDAKSRAFFSSHTRATHCRSASRSPRGGGSSRTCSSITGRRPHK